MVSTTDWEEVTALGEPSRNGCDGRVRCHPLIMHSVWATILLGGFDKDGRSTKMWHERRASCPCPDDMDYLWGVFGLRRYRQTNDMRSTHALAHTRQYEQRCQWESKRCAYSFNNTCNNDVRSDPLYSNIRKEWESNGRTETVYSDPHVSTGWTHRSNEGPRCLSCLSSFSGVMTIASRENWEHWNVLK